jgi:lipoyl-dependent peroxiredoxin
MRKLARDQPPRQRCVGVDLVGVHLAGAHCASSYHVRPVWRRCRLEQSSRPDSDSKEWSMGTVTGTERTAEVTWHGDLMNGSGTIESVGSGAFGPLSISWKARAETPDGETSPEELIAAAHAACFSMALSNELAQGDTPAETLSSVAHVTFVPGTGITRVALQVDGVVPGIDEAEFRAAAERAKEGCPVSQAVKGNVDLAVRAQLR